MSPSASASNRRMQRRRNGDGIAVQSKPKSRDNRHFDVPKPEARGDRDRRQQMRGVEQADIELVAHIRPRHLPYQLDIEALGSAANPLSTATISAVASASGMNPIRNLSRPLI